jgi:hypothetical protein
LTLIAGTRPCQRRQRKCGFQQGGVKLPQNEWLDDGALTDLEKALITQRFRDRQATPHASVSREEANLRLLTPFKR